MNRWAIFGIVIGGIILLIFMAYFFIGFFFYGISVNRVSLVGGIIDRVLNKRIKEYKINRKWWDKQNFEELTISAGKEKLVGYLIKNNKPSKKIAILVHGYYVTHKDVNAQSEIFLEQGFNVFAPDLRAHGKSSGRTITMGAYDKDDIILWIQKMIEIFGESCEIVLFGISMGGATVCLVSGKKIPKNVKCIISDCAYDSLEDQFKFILKEKIKLPEFPVMRIASRFIKMLGNYEVKDVKPREAVRKSKIPILFIHGIIDEIVPSYMAHNLYSSSNRNKCEIYLVEGAKHGMCYATDPDEYKKRMVEFIGKYIN